MDMKLLLTVLVCATNAWGGILGKGPAPLTSNHVITMKEAQRDISQVFHLVNITERQIDSFWRKVDQNGPIHPTQPELGGCWVWTVSKCRAGYGTFWCAGKVRASHRVSIVIHGGDLIDGLDVLHSCDRPFCVNPSHLRQGTVSDNVKDSIVRGRHVAPRGEASGMSKLTESQVKEIRRLFHEEGAHKLGLAKKFGVARSVILYIITRQTWKHIPDPPYSVNGEST